jgi:hypothetical protein
MDTIVILENFFWIDDSTVGADRESPGIDTKLLPRTAINANFPKRLFQKSFLGALCVSAVRKFTAKTERTQYEDMDFTRACKISKFPPTFTEDAIDFDVLIIVGNSLPVLCLPLPAFFRKQNLHQTLLQGFGKIDPIFPGLPQQIAVDAEMSGFFRSIHIIKVRRHVRP